MNYAWTDDISANREATILVNAIIEKHHVENCLTCNDLTPFPQALRDELTRMLEWAISRARKAEANPKCPP